MRVIARMNVGGPAVQVSGLMRNLPHDEFEHRLCTGWCAEDEADYLDTQAPDVEAIRIEGLGRAVKPGDDLRALRRLVREVREFRPHIIHTHTAKAGVLGRVAARVSGVNSAMVHTFHGHLLHGYFSPAKTKAVIQLERAFAARTDRLVAVGPQVRDDLLDAGIGHPGQFVVIPPGLELPTARPRDAMRAEFGLDPHAPVIAFIGRLTQIKRPDRFIEVVRQVAERQPDVQFLVAGAGDQADVIEDAARDLPITSLGWRSDVENVLAASDAVLLTSDNEGTPLSLIQAGMAGLPVIASAVGSVPDVVIQGETGWLASPTADALSAATLDMLDDPTEARHRGVAAASNAAAQYGVSRLVDDHATLYRTIAADRARR
jgi:glycosyltransferase involved in cell wall biosynthesis